MCMQYLHQLTTIVHPHAVRRYSTVQNTAIPNLPSLLPDPLVFRNMSLPTTDLRDAWKLRDIGAHVHIAYAY